MGREDNLRPKPFTSENQPKNRGSRKGIPNRSTILKKWLAVKLDVVNPLTQEKAKGTIEDTIMLALISKASKEDVPAIKEVQDTVYGKIKELHEIGGLDGESLIKPLETALLKIYDDISKRDK